MSVLSFFGYFVGIPALLVVLLFAWARSRKGAHAAPYAMSQSWELTHPPILWAAVDEAVGDGHGHGKSEFSVGGGVSGKW